MSRLLDRVGLFARRPGGGVFERALDAWIDSTANSAAVRLSYELIRKWVARVEYRGPDGPEADSPRQGFLASIDRELGPNFKVGYGYNFTCFSAHLTNLDYRFRGIFVNVVGKY